MLGFILDLLTAKLTRLHRLFWTALRSVWSRWARVLLIVKQDSGRHRAGFRLHWRWRSREGAGGRARITLASMRPKLNCSFGSFGRRRHLQSGLFSFPESIATLIL